MVREIALLDRYRIVVGACEQESRPSLRYTPTGTSARRRIRTASSSASRNAAAYSASGRVGAVRAAGG